MRLSAPAIPISYSTYSGRDSPRDLGDEPRHPHSRSLLQFRLFLGPTFPPFRPFWSVFGPFLASWTLRRIPFYVFLHFSEFQVPCITRFQVLIGSTPSSPFKCSRAHDDFWTFVYAWEMGLMTRFSPNNQSIFDRF
jgi:hypothetical protein